MRLIKTIGVALLGLMIVVTGFVYDVLFAGIPYQDPTPELQARYDFHSFVAGWFYKAGGIALLVGLIAAPIIWRRTRKHNTNNELNPSKEPVVGGSI
jgi:hypothetical protein